jgi:hypothetical protein
MDLMGSAGALVPAARARVRPRVAAVACGMALLAALAIALPGRIAPAITGPLLNEQSYRLAVDTRTGDVQVETPAGLAATSFPLAMWAGAESRPRGTELRVRIDGNTVTASAVERAGTVLQQAVLTAFRRWFTVRYSLGSDAQEATTPRFFYDGVRGLDVSKVNAGFSPDAPGSIGWPTLATAGRRPLAPAPLQVQVHTTGGWLGVGLLRVPNASSLRVDRGGSVAVNYPLHLLHSIPDTGGGGWSGGMIRFPAFIVTLSPTTSSGLAEYHTAVAAGGAAPAAAPQQAGWWHMPIVDTWGAQMAEHVIRGSQGFTADWVRGFVGQVQERYGLQRFTLVIDSRWEQELGSALPDVTRFGGVAGMRSLIDDLHAKGIRVLLWWPMWSTGTPSGGAATGAAVAAVDPTASDFTDTMSATVTEMLGQGPDDLAADGLKLDWEYAIPEITANPALGIGDAALYRYLQVIHTAAHAVRADALVEASAASPQFETVTDSVRLYDAWSEQAWDDRAAIVAAAEPGVLIDGDGWQATPADAVAHVLSSTVYGVPALYFGGTWASGKPVPEATARLLGSVAALAADKGAGEVVTLPGGGWELKSHGRDLAQTLNGETGAVVWSQSVGGATLGHVVSSVGGSVLIPLPREGGVTLVGPTGERVPIERAGNRVKAVLAAHDVYTITVR